MFAKIRKEQKTKFLSFIVYATVQDEVFTASISAAKISSTHLRKELMFSHVNGNLKSVDDVDIQHLCICYNIAESYG